MSEREPSGCFILPLKNGTRVDAILALGELNSLRRAIRNHPLQIDLLFKIVSGEHDTQRNATDARVAEGINFLEREGFLLRDGGLTVSSLVADILRVGYHLTPNGPTIEEPFDITNDRDRKVLKDAKSEMERLSKSFINDLISGTPKRPHR